jgi:hypothetical protein
MGKRKPEDEERISLAPLDPETALRALLATKPKQVPNEEPDASEADSEAR